MMGRTMRAPAPRLPRLLVVSLASIVLAASSLGCATYRDELVRTQQAYELDQHERALALLRDLEPDVGRLAPPERAQYAYLRGMTDYRLGYRADARHWLAIARAHEEASPGVLPTDWKARTATALEEMNEVVHAEGLAGLATSQKPGEDVAAEPATSSKGK